MFCFRCISLLNFLSTFLVYLPRKSIFFKNILFSFYIWTVYYNLIFFRPLVKFLVHFNCLDLLYVLQLVGYFAILWPQVFNYQVFYHFPDFLNWFLQSHFLSTVKFSNIVVIIVLFYCLSGCLVCRWLLPDIGLAVRVSPNGPGYLGSIPGRVIPKTKKMLLDASLLNTQHCKDQG